MLHWMIALCMGYILDLCFGDPYWLPHPIRLIGVLITKAEKVIRKVFPKTEKGELVGGFFFVFIVVGFSTLIPACILWIGFSIHFYLGLLIESIICYQMLATKSLKVESMKVYRKLRDRDLEGARQAVSMIVGRDTQNLTEEGIAKAAVETVAENTSDGIIAPMIYMAIGGPVLGFFYKAVNTMDSMVGYKNDNYIHFGRIAAKLDDILNYIPARISALFMIFASFILRMNYKQAWMIFKRDRFNHASPNSAQTESVCAGALEIQLAGDAYYFGKLHKKKTIGDRKKNVTCEDIVQANRLLYMTSFIGILLMLDIHVILGFVLTNFYR